MNAKGAHNADYSRLGGYSQIVRCVNAVSLSDSIYTDFAMCNTQDFTHYTKGNPKRLSTRVVSRWCA